MKIVALIEATATCPPGQYALGLEGARFVLRITRADLPGLLPPGFDPIGGARGCPAVSFDDDGDRRLCERILGGLYQASLMACVPRRGRLRGPKTPQDVPRGPAPILGILNGRIVAAVANIGPEADGGDLTNECQERP